MLGKLTSDVLGLSDVGSVIEPKDFDKVDADDYVLHEEGEKIYFLIKSKSDEYCFTNRALIHVDGESAVSKKRNLRRYDYKLNRISEVSLETAGTVDIDVEIKFKMGSVPFSIDVHKKYLEQLKDLYKSLIKIEEIMRDHETLAGYAKQSLELASAALSRNEIKESRLHEEFEAINRIAFSWMEEAKEKYGSKDFGHVFEKFINN